MRSKEFLFKIAISRGSFMALGRWGNLYVSSSEGNESCSHSRIMQRLSVITNGTAEYVDAGM